MTEEISVKSANGQGANDEEEVIASRHPDPDIGTLKDNAPGFSTLDLAAVDVILRQLKREQFGLTVHGDRNALLVAVRSILGLPLLRDRPTSKNYTDTMRELRRWAKIQQGLH